MTNQKKIDSQDLKLLLQPMGEGGLLQGSGFLDGLTLNKLALVSAMSQVDRHALLQLIELEFTRYHSLEDADLKAIKHYFRETGKIYWLKRKSFTELSTERESRRFQSAFKGFFITACRGGFEVMLQKILAMASRHQAVKSSLEEVVFKPDDLRLICNTRFADPSINKVIFAALMDFIPQQLREAVLAPHQGLSTIFHLAASSGNERIFPIFRGVISEEQQLEVAFAKDYEGNTVLHLAAHSKGEQIFLMFLEALPKERQLSAILNKNKWLETVVHKAAKSKNPQIVSRLFTLIPNELQLAAVADKNNNGDTCLHLAVDSGNEQVFLIFLEALPKERQLAAILDKNKQLETVVHKAAKSKNPQIVSRLFTLIPNEQWLQVMLALDQWGNTPLHLAAHSGNEQVFLMFLEALPKELRLAAVLGQNKQLETVVHKAAESENPQIVSRLFTLIPNEQWLQVILALDQWGNMPLHLAAYSGNEQVFLMFLEALPKEYRPRALLAQNFAGNTVFIFTTEMRNKQIFSTLLDFLPEERRLEAVLSQKNDTRTTALHLLRFYKSVVLKILDQLPDKDRLSAVLAEDDYHLTFLDHAISDLDYQDLIAILKKIPQSERISGFKFTKDPAHAEEKHDLYRFYRLSSSLNSAIALYQEQRSGFFGKIQRANPTRQQSIASLLLQMKDLESDMLNGTIGAKNALEQLQAAVTATKQETHQSHQQSASLRIGIYALTNSGFAAALAKIEEEHNFSKDEELSSCSYTGLTRNK